MIEYLAICLTSFLVSIIALFSGFGLGTVLMPVFAIFFPIPVAIASTAVVHLLNSIFKAALVGKMAKWNVVLQFGIPAAFMSAAGAYLLNWLASWQPIANYQLMNHEFQMTTIGLSIGTLIVLSSLFELIPQFSRLSFPPSLIPIGGALSGFFGGISGHQGILRSAFLIKSGLNAKEFIGTSVICSLVVDIVRVIVYGWAIYSENFTTLPREIRWILIAASLSAFLGSYIGARFIHKITFQTLQIIVGSMLLILGVGIAIGMI